jgi:hypothetical protein
MFSGSTGILRVSLLTFASVMIFWLEDKVLEFRVRIGKSAFRGLLVIELAFNGAHI